MLALLLFNLWGYTYAYNFTKHGTLNLKADNGWSQIGKACVGYTDQPDNEPYSPYDIHAAGYVEIILSNPHTFGFEHVSILLYNDQDDSFPMVNNSNLTCEEKLNGNYEILKDSITLNPSGTFERTIKLRQTIQTRWWYFYLVDCELAANKTYSNLKVAYTYSYWDFVNDTETCPDPSADISTTNINSNKHDTNNNNDDNSSAGSDTGSSTGSSDKVNNVLMWSLIAVVGMIFIVLVILCFIKYKKNHAKNSNKVENVLMESLNKEPYDLLDEWRLQQYAEVLINERGYDDIEQWQKLTMQDLEEMGFKEGHSRKFVDKVKDHFMDELVNKGDDQNQGEIEACEEGVTYTNQ